jgi:orotate phosphoribosyltransferase
MINFRSYSDLNKTIKDNISKIPKDIDLVVGIPRSGLLAANLIALSINKPLVDLEGFLDKKTFSSGLRLSNDVSTFSKIKKILIIDDSLNSGASLEKAKLKIEQAKLNKKIIYGVVYLKPGQEDKVDVYFEHCPMPRVFEWNIFHHDIITRSCVDIDGILCRDPTEEENDDGKKYIYFIRNVKLKIVPTVEISHLITCRLEKYRKDTEYWLKKNNIKYKNLVMMHYNTKAERIASGSHGKYKAEKYLESNTDLFIESDSIQANEIYNLTKRDVYSFDTSTMLTENHNNDNSNNINLITNNKKKHPSLDIILPTYNRAKKIKKALDSIINQTYHNWTLFVINDGGEDISKIVNKYKDKRIKYYNIKHVGKPGALNYGLKISNSPYISYMDDDDIIYPQHLELLLTAAIQNKREFVYSDTHLTEINDDSGEQISQRIENDQDVTYEMLRFQNYINHKQILHTRKLYEKVGEYDERLSILIDWDYIKRLAKESEPYHIKIITGNHFLYYKKKEINSISGLWTKDPKKVGQSLLTIFSKDSEAMVKVIKDFYESNNLKIQINNLVQEKEQIKSDSTNQINNLVQEKGVFQKENKRLKSDLNKIQSSKTYKLWQKYNLIKKIFN